MLIPLSDMAKGRCDVAAVSTAALAFFKAVPWPEIAAFLASLYTALRIIEFVVGRFKRRS